MIERSEFIKGLRDAADFWEQHPDVPVPQYGHDISVHTQGDDDVAAFRFVEDCAAAMGVVAGPPRDGSTHYAARLAFGPVVLEAIAIPASVMADHREKTRLGEEALAAKKAAAHVDEADWEALGDCIADDQPPLGEGDRVRNRNGTAGRVLRVTLAGRVCVLWDGMAADAWVVYDAEELELIERAGPVHAVGVFADLAVAGEVPANGQ